MEEATKQVNKKALLDHFLNGVGNAGNRLPHPITTLALLVLGIALISGLYAALGVLVAGGVIDSKTMELTEQTISVVSLMNREGLVYMLASVVTSFTSFTPLGVVLVTMLGMKCAEGSGYLSTLIKKAVSVASAMIMTPMLVFLGVMSNMASDTGYVVLIPIGAVVFMAYDRHPIAGLAAAFAGVSGGFSANLLVGTLNPMLSGIGTEAVKIINPDYMVTATANWYFILVSTFVIVAVGTFVTDKIMGPRLSAHRHNDGDAASATTLGDNEEKALKMASLSLLALVAFIATLTFPQDSFLRNPVTDSLMTSSPLTDGLTIIIAPLFFVPSIIYGRVAGTYKNRKDIRVQLDDNMSAMGEYIVLSFATTQFTSYFNYTKVEAVLALKGAEALGAAGVGSPVLMILSVFFVAVTSLLMGSASAGWTVLALVLVPMFMLLGYSPELTQMAYRIGDSYTDLITPLMSYFAIVVIFARKYDRESDIGTPISTMLPYGLFFMTGWAVLLVIWMIFDLPLGPGAGLFV